MDGATSGARHNSKRLKTDPLAADKARQHEWRIHRRSDIPRPSSPPPEHPRPLTDYADPPCCRGRLKSHTRKIRRSTMRRLTHQVILLCRAQSGHIEHIRYVKYTVQRLGQHPTVMMNEKDHQGACSRVRQQDLNS